MESFMARKPFKLKVLVPTEKTEQEIFMKWLWKAYPKVYEMAYAVPNGRTSMLEGLKYKRLGAKAGVPDVVVDFPVEPYHGLRIEFKRREGGVVSETQQEWLDKLNRLGYLACIAKGWEEGAAIVEKYLGN